MQPLTWHKVSGYPSSQVQKYVSALHKVSLIFDPQLTTCQHTLEISLFSFRLHRMHEMQTIVTDVHGVCLSVCHAPHIRFAAQKNGWTDQAAVYGEHSWRPTEHCVRRESWAPHREGWPSFKFWDLLVSSERLKLGTWNFACWHGGALTQTVQQ